MGALEQRIDAVDARIDRGLRDLRADFERGQQEFRADLRDLRADFRVSLMAVLSAMVVLFGGLLAAIKL